MPSVLLDKKGNGVAVITINRPEAMNAMNLEVMKALNDTFVTLKDDTDVRVIVLTGAGDRAFCAGGDIKAGADGKDSPYQMLPGDDHPLVQLFKAVTEINVPVIARVNGHALGGGFGLICMADMAICSRNAKLGSPEAKVGLFPMVILVHMLRLVPLRKLYEMAITGRHWDADEAVAAGVINTAVDTVEELDAEMDSLLSSILKNSPTAIRVGKKALREMEYMSFEERCAHAQIVIDALSRTADAKEGMAAFAEKRKPVWVGR